ncbi:hypothetical protein FNV43_RR16767 [Rhamnella rubrinervis]|uniref:Uncharacterized protein n=1 Tax=Rhamnella rubrinervis TaxID=2594499 RepID=A0A8K0MCJ4_9ROSA|nr:hypothetical protein FNV43_RR16767 [Rhamnella rubrinervis]
MVRQGQQGQHPGGRRAGAVHLLLFIVHIIWFNYELKGTKKASPNLKATTHTKFILLQLGLLDVPMASVSRGMFSIPYDMGGMPMRDAVLSQIPIGALATALANASLEQQRTVSIWYVW